MTTRSATSIASFFNCHAQHPVSERIFSCLNEMDKIELAVTCKKQYGDFVRLEKLCAQLLTQHIVAQKEKVEIYLTDKNGNQEKTHVISLLGSGGFKGAWLLENAHALLLPNLGGIHNRDRNSVRVEGLGRWKRNVKEEVEVSSCLTSIGLLSPQHRSVKVAETRTALAGSLPAYVSISFAELAKQGIFVIDPKNPDVSTWTFPEFTTPSKKQDYIFQNPEDRNAQENWELVFDPLITDIAKIYAYSIPYERDSAHCAVVRQAHDASLKTDYVIRYFGFDFSGSRPVTKPEPRPFNKEEAGQFALRSLNPIIDTFLRNEFGCQPPAKLSFNLKLSCARASLARMEKLSKQHKT